MRFCLVFLFVLSFTLLLFCQQSSTGTRVDQWIWSRGKMMPPETPPELDTKAVRLQAIQKDAEELSRLSASLQPDLQKLAEGLLAKDLDEKLRKMEKLSKRLRREVAP